MTIHDIDDTHNFSETRNQPNPIQIKVLGVGGGGCNAVNYMFQQKYENITYAIANTDRQALHSSKVPTQVLLGPKTCGGNGAGAVAELARKAAEESTEAIQALFNDATKVVFITAGMGGGTGTGASPVIARIAKERGILTVGIITIPFLFEGMPKIKAALEGAKEMSKHVDVMLVVNNQRLVDIYPDLDFMNAFHKADETLCDAAKSISDLINKTGYINCDLRDVTTTLRDGGTAIISTGYGSGEERITEAIENSLNSPLLKNKNIYTAERMLICIHFNPKSQRPFKMAESKQLTSFTTGFPNIKVFIWGTYPDETLGDEIKVSVLAAGFDNDSSVTDTNEEPKTEDTETKNNPDDEKWKKQIVNMYDDPVQLITPERQRFFILTREQLDDASILDMLEKYPTYNRDKSVVDRFRNMAKENAETQNPSSGSLQAGSVVPY